jgi:outer membrane immunogenic protein
MKKFLIAGLAAAAITSGAQAADLGVPRGAIADVVVAPVFSWTGFYIGAHLGYGTSSVNYLIDPGAGNNSFSRSANGLLGGAQIGYNYQINNFVLGIEADYSFAGLRTGNYACTIGQAATCNARVNGLGSVRGRAGVAVDRALLYLTAGLGVGSFRYGRAFDVPPPAITGASSTRAGLVVGGGAEFAVTQNVTIRGEYLYYHFNNPTFAIGTLSDAFTTRVQSNVHTFRVGVNYLFSTGGSAVVARY